jgi:2-amino-4,5-dihydroxy-6-oxo-7-(phosphonooxy)heptanoate synthase
VAGGAPSGDLLAQVQQALEGGAAGIAVGRNIIRADDVSATTRKLADVVHGRYELGVTS